MNIKIQHSPLPRVEFLHKLTKTAKQSKLWSEYDPPPSVYWQCVESILSSHVSSYQWQMSLICKRYPFETMMSRDIGGYAMWVAFSCIDFWKYQTMILLTGGTVLISDMKLVSRLRWHRSTQSLDRVISFISLHRPLSIHFLHSGHKLVLSTCPVPNLAS